MMKLKLFLLAAALLPNIFSANLANAQSNKVIVGYANFSPTYAPVWVAKEIGFFESITSTRISYSFAAAPWELKRW